MVPLEGGDDPAAEPRPAGVPGVLRRARRRLRPRGREPGAVASHDRTTSSRRRDRARGKALVLHRPDRATTPPRSSATSPALKTCARGRRRGRRVPPRRRSGERLLAAQRVLRERGGVRLRRRRRPARGVPAHRRRGLPAPGRRRGAAARVRLDPLARRLGRRLPALGGAAGRGAQPRARGASRRSGSATTSASAAGTARTPSTPRSPT